MRVLVFGDSITQGYWAIKHGWVDRVRMNYDSSQLQDLDGKDEPTIFNLGISADNSTDILNRIEAEVIARTRPHHQTKPVTIIQTGINDSAGEPTEPQVALQKYKNNLESIIKKVKQLSSKIVFVGFSACDESKTLPVSWGDHNYSNESIGKYEHIMSQVADENGVDFIPVFDNFKSLLSTGEDLLVDGLHPNEAGHKAMYQIIMPKLQELLK
jgi:lysophospholipase L1-like esterase